MIETLVMKEARQETRCLNHDWKIPVPRVGAATQLNPGKWIFEKVILHLNRSRWIGAFPRLSSLKPVQYSSFYLINSTFVGR